MNKTKIKRTNPNKQIEYDVLIDNTNEHNVRINGVIISEKIFNEELSNFKVIERLNLIDDLIDWISEAKGNDKRLMKDDLKYLINLKDEYILSNIGTNEYIAKSDNLQVWNDICEELLELNAKRTPKRMKVKDLIKELKGCKQNADVSIVVGNEDNNVLETYYFELHAKDIKEYVELFVFNKTLCDFGKRYLSTNLESDENMKLNGRYKLEVDKYRNGNLNLIDVKTNEVICEFQNNEVQDE